MCHEQVVPAPSIKRVKVKRVGYKGSKGPVQAHQLHQEAYAYAWAMYNPGTPQNTPRARPSRVQRDRAVRAPVRDERREGRGTKRSIGTAYSRQEARAQRRQRKEYAVTKYDVFCGPKGRNFDRWVNGQGLK